MATLGTSTAPAVTAPNEDRLVTAIRQQYAATRQALPTLRKKRIDVWDWSTEGAEATGYYKGNSLRLAEAHVYGEMGQAHIGYYFHDEQLIFVLEQNQNYAVPMPMRPSLAGSTFKTERFYFHQGQLIRWLGTKNQLMAVSTPDYSEKQKQLLDQAQELQQLLAAKPKR